VIRVLIVDDSLATRSAIRRALSEQADFEVLRPAANGTVALQRVEQDAPDVVVLDIEMPGIDGLQVLDAISIRKPEVPVIMFSGLTEQGASTSLDALARGAIDVMAKPASSEELPHTMTLLAARIREIGSQIISSRQAPSENDRRGRHTGAEVQAVVVGVSTGGPNALMDLLPRFSSDFPVPILVVQHMPPLFTRQLAERLDRRTALTVSEAADGDVITGGHVLIAPGGRHMGVTSIRGEKVVKLTDTPRQNSCRPAVDVLFETAADCYGPNALGVVLTGMGQDGLIGSESLVAAGSAVLAQDEASSVVWGMPGAVVRKSLATRVLPLPMIAGEVDRRVRGGHVPQEQETS